MIVKFLGDVHGCHSIFQDGMVAKGDHPFCVVQVGDFGFYPDRISGDMDYQTDGWKETSYPIYFIDGNHEHFDYLEQECARVGMKEDGTYEVRPNLFYVPRGTILDLYGIKIGCMGGAESIDKAWRLEGSSWFKQESVTQSDIDKLWGKTVDILVTHSPPSSVIRRNFPPLNKLYWQLPLDWVDTSSEMIEELWSSMGRPKMFCGHFHKSLEDGTCTILDINEFLECTADSNVELGN